MNGPRPVTFGEWLLEAARRLRAAGVEDPELEARLLLGQVCGLRPVEVVTNPRRALSGEARSELDALVGRRIDGMPIQYLTRTAPFRNLEVEVGPGVFVPRPETEGLVERVLTFLRSRPAGWRVLELCLGSGAILASILSEQAGGDGVGVDLSPMALRYARKNVEAAGVAERARLLEGDLYAPLAGPEWSGAFDVVVVNPPYVPEAAWEDLPRDVRDFEPRLALVGGPDGTDVIRRIVAGAPAVLKAGGLVALEIDESHGARVRELMEAVGAFSDVRIEEDLSGRPRYALGVRSQERNSG